MFIVEYDGLNDTEKSPDLYESLSRFKGNVVDPIDSNGLLLKDYPERSNVLVNEQPVQKPISKIDEVP